MPQINPYLNFDGDAEEAFDFYQSIFGGEIIKHKMGSMPGDETPLSEEEQNRMMHISLTIGGNILMASDILPSAGHVLNKGNYSYISVFTDSREQADQYFKGLSDGATIEMPLEDAFWGDYFGSLFDKYGIPWMINYPAQQGA